MLATHQVGPNWPYQIRDRYLYGSAWVGSLLVTWVEPGLGILMMLTVARWRNLDTLPPVLTLGIASAVYCAVKMGRPDAGMLQAVIVAVAMVQSVWAGYGVIWQGMRQFGATLHQARDFGRGSLGNRVVIATYCAFAAPLAPLWALPILAFGLLITNSYTGMAAALLGLCVTYPDAAPYVLGGTIPAVPALVWWRGNPVDSLDGRVRIWALSFAVLWSGPWWRKWVGLGPGAITVLNRWWTVRKWTGQFYRQAHNDLVEVTLEHGILGGIAVLWWAANVFRHVGWGDPLSGAVVAMALAMLVQFPAHLPQTAIPMLCIAGLLAGRGLT